MIEGNQLILINTGQLLVWHIWGNYSSSIRLFHLNDYLIFF